MLEEKCMINEGFYPSRLGNWVYEQISDHCDSSSFKRGNWERLLIEITIFKKGLSSFEQNPAE